MPHAWRHGALAVLLAACQAGGGRPERRLAVAAADGGAPDGGTVLLSWVDVAVAGCPRYDPSVPSCEGTAPRELRFTALAPVPPQTFLWSFGDGSPAESTPAPVHRFARPGSYTVTVTVGGPSGTVQSRREAFVRLGAAADGEECATGRGCAEGLACVCPEGCPGLVGPGFCAAACDERAPCPATQVCVDPGPRGGGDGWPASACVPTCGEDSQCAPGRRCRELPAAAPAGGWTRACVPLGLLADEGGVCRDGTGALDDGLCLNRDCAPLGARGLCAAMCDGAHPCPSYASCVTFTTGERRCLARCAAERPCDDDPFLACQLPDSRGSLGFTAPDPAVKLCSPRRCAGAADCGPDGSCEMLGQASFCLKKSG